MLYSLYLSQSPSFSLVLSFFVSFHFLPPALLNANVVTLNDLSRDATVTQSNWYMEFKDYQGSSHSHIALSIIVDKYMCDVGDTFFGSPQSSFSKDINRIRDLEHKNAFNSRVVAS